MKKKLNLLVSINNPGCYVRFNRISYPLGRFSAIIDEENLSIYLFDDGDIEDYNLHDALTSMVTFGFIARSCDEFDNLITEQGYTDYKWYKVDINFDVF